MFLVLPKMHPVLDEYRNLPMFFFGGPILGGGDWHSKMSEMLMRRLDELIIVNPSRYSTAHPHYKYREYLETKTKHAQRSGPIINFERQTDWERYYLALAAEHWGTGCVIFWLAEQKEPRADGMPYAMDTRGELGEWRAHLMYNPHVRVVIGAEKNFPGLSVIKRNFELALPNFTIYDTMEEVVERAVHFSHPSLSFLERART